MFTHFSPKTTIFGLLRGHFWPKTWKIKCFQFIQSKISQFVTQMWLPKKLQFLVPGTPPEPPIPPLTPPRGPGGPKMAKMHSLKSNNDNQCQKSHFRGVKNFDLFFHLECPCFPHITTFDPRSPASKKHSTDEVNVDNEKYGDGHSENTEKFLYYLLVRFGFALLFYCLGLQRVLY